MFLTFFQVFFISSDFSEVNELFLAEVSCHPFRSAPGVKFGMSKMREKPLGWKGSPSKWPNCKWLENGGWSYLLSTYLPGMILQEVGCFFRFPKKNKQVCWKMTPTTSHNLPFPLHAANGVISKEKWQDMAVIAIVPPKYLALNIFGRCKENDLIYWGLRESQKKR